MYGVCISDSNMVFKQHCVWCVYFRQQYVMSCWYSAMSLTLVRKEHFIRMSYYNDDVCVSDGSMEKLYGGGAGVPARFRVICMMCVFQTAAWRSCMGVARGRCSSSAFNGWKLTQTT